MENYFNWLEEEYDKACKEYEEDINSLKNSYSKAKIKISLLKIKKNLP